METANTFFAIVRDDGEYIHYEHFFKTKKDAEAYRSKWYSPQRMPDIVDVEFEDAPITVI